MINWNHYLAPRSGEPLFVWGKKLGYNVEIIGKTGYLLVVTPSTI